MICLIRRSRCWPLFSNLAATLSSLLLLTGCEQNPHDTTITDAKVEALARRIDLKGNDCAINELKTFLESEASHPRGNLLLAELMLRQNPEKADVDKCLQRATAKNAPMETQLWAAATLWQLLFERGDKDKSLSTARQIAADAARERWPDTEKQLASVARENGKRIGVSDDRLNRHLQPIETTP